MKGGYTVADIGSITMEDLEIEDLQWEDKSTLAAMTDKYNRTAKGVLENREELKKKLEIVTKKDLGLDKVDNTSDENKPLSKAQREALADVLKSEDLNDVLRFHLSADSMRQDTEAQAGTIVVTFGWSQVNDGGSAVYRISETQSGDPSTIVLLNNGLYAIPITGGFNIPEFSTAAGADYAEYGEWYDGNPADEDRVGYFVTIRTDTNDIVKANSNSVIVGVTSTPESAGFIGNYKPEYREDTSMALVSIMGQVNVIDNGLCTVGQRCMPASDGTAMPSDNEYGYLVIQRIDDDTVRILVSPTIDSVYRIRTDLKEVQDKLDNFDTITSDTVTQLFDSAVANVTWTGTITSDSISEMLNTDSN